MSQPSPHSSALSLFLPSLPKCSLSLRWGVLIQMPHSELNTQDSFPLHSGLSALTATHSGEKLSGLAQAARIHVYKCKDLEGSLKTWPFSKTAAVGPMTSQPCPGMNSVLWNRPQIQT